MKTSYRAQAAILLAFVFGLFLINLFAADREFSPVENRNLAKKPVFSWEGLFSGEFMQDFEEYATDQFAGRDLWTAVKAYAERATGKKENNGIYILGDTLIEKTDALDESQLERNLQTIDRFMAQAEIPTYLMLIPSAAEIWAEKLPDGAPNIDQAEALENMADRTQAQAVDVCSALMEHAGEYIFYRTDHHWTSLGACYGADALLGAMGRSGVSPQQWEARTVSEEFYGTLWSGSGARYISPDRIETYVPADGVEVESFEGGEWSKRELYDLSKLEGKDKYAVFLGGNQPLAVIRTGRGEGKLLLIRDSFADCMVPFLLESFSEIHLIDPRYYRLNAAEYVRENGIDAVAVVYSLKNFASDRNIYFIGLEADRTL